MDESPQKDFFKRLNVNKPNAQKLELAADSLNRVLTKEVKYKDLNERLLKSRQEKVTVREVVLESEIEFVNSLKQLKVLFKSELTEAIQKVNDLYNSELLKLQKLYKSEVVGDALLEIVKTISQAGWILLMKDTGVFVYKCYSPTLEVTEGYTDSGVIKEFEESVCSLKGIYVNILHPKILFGTILLSTEGQHPNCEKAYFGSACVGTLEDREIPVDNPQELLGLLNEIQACYEVIHLDSCFYEPKIKFITRKDTTKWKATG